MRSLSWAEKHVIQSAGIPLEEVTDQIAILAEIALQKCYYIDLAAIELRRMLGAQ